MKNNYVQKFHVSWFFINIYIYQKKILQILKIIIVKTSFKKILHI